MIELKKTIKLQKIVRKEGYEFHTLVLPKSFIELLGWDKGDELNATLIIGSGKITLEKEE